MAQLLKRVRDFEMTRETFTQIAPLLCFLLMVFRDDRIFLAGASFIAGASVACRFSLDAESRNDLPSADPDSASMNNRHQ
jgi:hypothetical protein